MNKIATRMIIIIIILVMIFFSAFIYRKMIGVNYIPTAYELELIDYFKDISLKSEYDDNPQRITKWNSPMFIYVIKDKPCVYQMEAIKKTIDHINQLATDGFKIELTNDYSKKNTTLYLLSKSKVTEIDSNLFIGIEEDFAGLAETEFHWADYSIYKSKIFIDRGESIQLQRMAILEEITQSIGLMNDSELYPDSVFYQGKKENDSIEKYSNIDQDIIQLLYHPRMRSGLNEKQVERVIKKILKNKEIKLSQS